MRNTSYDALAVKAMLKGGEKALAKVWAHAKGEVECPECGSEGPHEHNHDRLDPMFLCEDCGYCFEDPGVHLGEDDEDPEDDDED